MALTRLQQLCLRAEAVEGTFLSPFTSTYANYLAIDPSLTFDVETYERSVARESFTPLAPLAGAVLGSASFSLEATSRSATVGPPAARTAKKSPAAKKVRESARSALVRVTAAP